MAKRNLKGDLVKVKHGYWKPLPHSVGHEPLWECSRCGKVEDDTYDYCHCGAKMDGGAK